MPTYYALYINDTIKTIFSSMYEFHKWVEVIYKPMHRNIKDLNICVKYLENMYEDDNYSLYLLVTESKDKIDHKFFSTTDDLKKEFTKRDPEQSGFVELSKTDSTSIRWFTCSAMVLPKKKQKML